MNSYVFGSKIETGGWWSYHETPQQIWDHDDHVIDPTTGLVRWKMGNPVPKDIVVAWNDVGLLSDFDTARAVTSYDAELDLFFSAYRANQPSEPTAEQRFEARAAHGPGVEIVDVISGRRFTT